MLCLEARCQDGGCKWDREKWVAREVGHLTYLAIIGMTGHSWVIEIEFGLASKTRCTVALRGKRHVLAVMFEKFHYDLEANKAAKNVQKEVHLGTNNKTDTESEIPSSTQWLARQ